MIVAPKLQFLKVWVLLIGNNQKSEIDKCLQVLYVWLCLKGLSS